MIIICIGQEYLIPYNSANKWLLFLLDRNIWFLITVQTNDNYYSQIKNLIKEMIAMRCWKYNLLWIYMKYANCFKKKIWTSFS